MGFLMLLLPMTESQERRCNEVELLLSDGNEQFQTVQCFPNCTNGNCTGTWFKLPLSGDQQPASNGTTLIWKPGITPKGQFVCVDERNITVKQVLIISENGKHLSISNLYIATVYAVIRNKMYLCNRYCEYQVAVI